jgi:hypothetical protein
VGVQELRWKQETSQEQEIILFFNGKGNEYHLFIYLFIGHENWHLECEKPVWARVTCDGGHGLREA